MWVYRVLAVTFLLTMTTRAALSSPSPNRISDRRARVLIGQAANRIVVTRSGEIIVFGTVPLKRGVVYSMEGLELCVSDKFKLRHVIRFPKRQDVVIEWTESPDKNGKFTLRQILRCLKQGQVSRRNIRSVVVGLFEAGLLDAALIDQRSGKVKFPAAKSSS